MDFDVPVDHRVKFKKKRRMVEKYLELVRELKY